MEQEFWLVWNESGSNPSHRHYNEHSAIDEASRLAAKDPGQRFYVAHVTGYSKTTDVAYTRLDELPF